VYDFDDPVLLFGCHLVVTRQAQAPAEDVRADIGNAARYVGVAAGAAATLSANERKLPEKRL